MRDRVSLFTLCEVTSSRDVTVEELETAVNRSGCRLDNGGEIRFEFHGLLSSKPSGKGRIYTAEAWAEYLVPEDEVPEVKNAAFWILKSDTRPPAGFAVKVVKAEYGGRLYGTGQDCIVADKRIGVQGNSLSLNITKEAQAMGLGRGDYVRVTIERIVSQ